ncbi:MAG: HAMP domain-containing histidine kinase [Chloroflexi bacterium]|nr:HAMP domain-containing histidine kinase [Chloroflexota bacterium]
MTDATDQVVSWRIGVIAVAGLLIAIAIIGIVGIVINRSVQEVVDRAIAFDVELEDNADDLRVAALDVRHYHRDMIFSAPLAPRVEAWEKRYRALLAEIDELEALMATGVERAGLPTTDELRSLAEGYYADFRPAIDAYDPDDRTAFDVASDAGLAQLNALENLAAAIDKEGEDRAADAFTAIDEAVATGTWALVAVIVGLGAVGGALGLAALRMIGGSHRLVAAQQAAAAQLAEVSRAKTDFIADASHELRTPLTVLRGNAEVGLAVEDEGERTEILHEIVTESARMSRLVDDLLFLARSDAATVPLELRMVDTRELLEALVGRADVVIRGRGVTLGATVDVAGAVRVDAARLEQAVLILVDNAAKYGPRGKTVDLHARFEDNALVIEVSDRGPGITERDRARIFERFYRGNGQGSRRASGAGLGLAIARAIVEGHGGTIAAADRPGGGTTMRISLLGGGRLGRRPDMEAS